MLLSLLQKYANDHVDVRKSLSVLDNDDALSEVHTLLAAFLSANESPHVLQGAIENVNQDFQPADRQSKGIYDVLTELRPSAPANKTI